MCFKAPPVVVWVFWGLKGSCCFSWFSLVLVIAQLFPCWASLTSALWRRPLQVGQVFPLCAFPTSSGRSHHISSNHPINPVQDIFVYYFLTMPFTTRMSLPSFFDTTWKKRYCLHSVYLYHRGNCPGAKKKPFKERQDTEDLSKLCGSTSLVVAVVPYTSPFPSAPPMLSILDLTASTGGEIHSNSGDMS